MWLLAHLLLLLPIVYFPYYPALCVVHLARDERCTLTYVKGGGEGQDSPEFDPGKGERCSLKPALRHTPSLLRNGCSRLLQESVLEIDHLPPSIAEVQEWSYTYPPPLCLSWHGQLRLYNHLKLSLKLSLQKP